MTMLPTRMLLTQSSIPFNFSCRLKIFLKEGQACMVVTKRYKKCKRRVYYMGEVNDMGEPHGVGLQITSFK